MDLEEDGETINSGWLTNSTIELIEDNNIDIDSIEELKKEILQNDWSRYAIQHHNKINELVRGYNKLNREIKELKRK